MDFTVRQMDFEGAKRLYPQHGLNGIGVHTPSVSELTVNDKRELALEGKADVKADDSETTVVYSGGLAEHQLADDDQGDRVQAMLW